MHIFEILVAWRGERFRRVRNVQNLRPQLVSHHATDIRKKVHPFDIAYSERDDVVAENSDNRSSEEKYSNLESETELLDESNYLSFDFGRYFEELIQALPSSKIIRIDSDIHIAADQLIKTLLQYFINNYWQFTLYNSNDTQESLTVRELSS